MLADLFKNSTLNFLARKAQGLNSTKFDIGDFTYRNNIVKETMFKHLNNTDFQGITVRRIQ